MLATLVHHAQDLNRQADTDQIANVLEASFLENGMDVEVLEDLWNDGVAAFRAFINIFIGFMGLGLVVGVAALGFVSTRAVVERRQQIGVLRAIGYRRRMVQLSFLLESSFIALFGTAIGVVLGLCCPTMPSTIYGPRKETRTFDTSSLGSRSRS